MKLITLILVSMFAVVFGAIAQERPMKSEDAFVRVSPRDFRYLELSNGQPYIPIGINLVGSPKPDEFDSVLSCMEKNRLNYCRIWLNHGSFLFEREKSGVFDETTAKNLGNFLGLARKHGIRVKLCLEYFRAVNAKKSLWSDSTIHHLANGGYFADMNDFLQSERGIAQFKEKLAWYRTHTGDSPAIYAWELWNEMNCVGPNADWKPWTRIMLAELHRLFPKNMSVQSLGSFDSEGMRAMYGELAKMQGNDIVQVHRYLDLGARWAVCNGPVDVLAAEAVREMLAFGVGKPVILAESGAVEPSHTGPFKLYAKDVDGTLLHDVLWAPFVAGAAGPGQIWHWDKYVEGNKIWWQFARFAEAVEGIDPPSESFEPLMIEHPRLRIYVLRGKHTLLAWCRDKQNDWRAELLEGKAPETLTGLTVNLTGQLTAGAKWNGRTFDPWTDKWQDVNSGNPSISLPAFRRSMVIRLNGDFRK